MKPSERVNDIESITQRCTPGRKNSMAENKVEDHLFALRQVVTSRDGHKALNDISLFAKSCFGGSGRRSDRSQSQYAIVRILSACQVLHSALPPED